MSTPIVTAAAATDAPVRVIAAAKRFECITRLLNVSGILEISPVIASRPSIISSRVAIRLLKPRSIAPADATPIPAAADAVPPWISAVAAAKSLFCAAASLKSSAKFRVAASSRSISFCAELNGATTEAADCFARSCALTIF